MQVTMFPRDGCSGFTAAVVGSNYAEPTVEICGEGGYVWLYFKSLDAVRQLAARLNELADDPRPPEPAPPVAVLDEIPM